MGLLKDYQELRTDFENKNNRDKLFLDFKQKYGQEWIYVFDILLDKNIDEITCL